jgi:two-component system response regulator HydG
VLIGGDDPSDLPPLEEVERRYILHVLEAAGGSRTRAAEVLGLARKTLYRKLLQFGATSTVPADDRPSQQGSASGGPVKNGIA